MTSASAPVGHTPVSNVGGPSSGHTNPRDVKVVTSILRDVGVRDYEPQVISQMLEFTYRYVVDVLDDARAYAEHAKHTKIDSDDVKLAIQLKANNVFAGPPPPQLLAEIAEQKNRQPLPPVKQQCGLRLPPDRYCLTQPNYQLKHQSHGFNVGRTLDRPFNSLMGPFGSQASMRLFHQQSQIFTGGAGTSPSSSSSSSLGYGVVSKVHSSSAVDVDPVSMAVKREHEYSTAGGPDVEISTTVYTHPSNVYNTQNNTTYSIPSNLNISTLGGGTKRKVEETLDEDYDV